jgi:RNA polymerase sigma-70 factor (ECF subfamily)
MNSLDNTNSTRLPDEQLLLQKTAEGSREAYTVLYSYYTPLLYRQLFPLTHESKEDTEEIIQELFLKIWEKRDVLIAIQSFQAYVFRMARNIMVSQYRKKTVRQRLFVELEHQGDHLCTLTEEDILFVEYKSIALEAIAQLPPRQRQIFELRTEEDLSLNEIATLLGIGLPAVKKQLYAAINFVKAWLRRHAGWLVGLIMLLKAL